MQRLLVVLLLLPALVLGACGSSSSDSSTSSADKPKASGPKKLEPQVAESLLRINFNIANYCVRATGAKIGRTSPPTAHQTLLKNNGVKSLLYEIKEEPNAVVIKGKRVRDLAQSASDALSRSCDPRSARSLEDAVTEAAP